MAKSRWNSDGTVDRLDADISDEALARSHFFQPSKTHSKLDAANAKKEETEAAITEEEFWERETRQYSDNPTSTKPGQS